MQATRLVCQRLVVDFRFVGGGSQVLDANYLPVIAVDWEKKMNFEP